MGGLLLMKGCCHSGAMNRMGVAVDGSVGVNPAAAAVVYDVVRRVVSRATRRPREVSEIEIAEVTTAGGDRVVMVRAKRDLS
jgi:hypothetical protein